MLSLLWFCARKQDVSKKKKTEEEEEKPDMNKFSSSLEETCDSSPPCSCSRKSLFYWCHY